MMNESNIWNERKSTIVIINVQKIHQSQRIIPADPQKKFKIEQFK